MTQQELIEKVAEKIGVSKSAVKMALHGIITAMSEELDKDGGYICLRGLGVFRTKSRPAYTGRNPLTGAPVPVPAKLTVHFRRTKREE